MSAPRQAESVARKREWDQYAGDIYAVDFHATAIDLARMSSNLQIAFGERLRALREARGVSQEAFAASADIDRATYGRLERGKINPGLITMARVCVALEVSLSELMEGLVTPSEEVRALPRSKRGRRSI